MLNQIECKEHLFKTQWNECFCIKPVIFKWTDVLSQGKQHYLNYTPEPTCFTPWAYFPKVNLFFLLLTTFLYSQKFITISYCNFCTVIMLI